MHFIFNQLSPSNILTESTTRPSKIEVFRWRKKGKKSPAQWQACDPNGERAVAQSIFREIRLIAAGLLDPPS
jgi:hypothetical protein